MIKDLTATTDIHLSMITQGLFNGAYGRRNEFDVVV